MQPREALPLIMGIDLPLDDYPESLQTDAIERSLSATLPLIEGLNELSDSQRLMMFKRVTASARLAFIQTHGDPFGCEVMQAEAHREIEKINA